MMNFQFLYLLIASLIYISKCEDLKVPSNYTLSYFKSLDMLTMGCKSDSDCPQYSKCGKYTTDDKVEHSVCRFGSFLCPENDAEKCDYINTKMYDLNKNSMNKDFSKDTKPILKTCPKYKVKKFLFKCSTEKCSKNEDCYSGMCYEGSCIVNKDKPYHDIFRCTGDDKNRYLKCGRNLGIQCNGDMDCYSGRCNKGYCAKTSKFSWKTVLYIAGILLLGFIIFLIYEYFFGDDEEFSYKKNRK